MIIRFFLLALLVGVVMGFGAAQYALAISVMTLSSIYYIVSFALHSGLYTITVEKLTKAEAHNSLMIAAVNSAAVLGVLLATPFSWVGFMALPWVTIITANSLLHSAVAVDILELDMDKSKKGVEETTDNEQD